MATSKLKIYNRALIICGERILDDLTEDVKGRRLLDEVWDEGGLEACLEEAQWKFAMKSVKLDYDTSISPNFGFKRAFIKPTDWMITSAMCSDEFYSAPLIQYTDENDVWYSELDIIYVKYVSNAVTHGLDYSKWPSTFGKFVNAYFANEIVMGLSQDESLWAKVNKKLDLTRKEAKNKDAMAGPQKFPAPGRFVTSRYRGRSTFDRGNRSQLIG